MQQLTDTQVIITESARMHGMASQVEGVMSVSDVRMVLNTIRYTWEMAPEVPAQYCANALLKAVRIQERTGSAESLAHTTREWEAFSAAYGR